MKKMITLLFSFALIFVGSVGASDDPLTSLMYRENSSVSVSITFLNNLKSDYSYMSTDLKFSSGENYYSTKAIENDSVTVRYRNRKSNKNISAEEFKSIQQQADSLLQQGYCQTVSPLDDISKISTLVTPGGDYYKYSSEDQCLQALSNLQAALVARKASGQA